MRIFTLEICDLLISVPNISGITYVIEDLKPDTAYLIRVASLNPSGLSDWMGPKEFRTHAKAGIEADTSKGIQATSHSVVMNLIHLLILFKAYDLFSPYEWN